MASATAPALEAIQGGALHIGSQTLREPRTPEVLRQQPSLFWDAITGTKVIPIPTLTPMRHPGERGSGDAPPRRAASRGSNPRASRRSADQSQQSLELVEAREAARPFAETIYCDAPVASVQHRAVATAADVSVILIALGVFLLMFILCGGEVELNRQLVLLLGGVGAVIGLFYRFLWCLAGGDSPGMRFAGLRLVDFDGRPPDREKRCLRLVASLLSLFSAGLGLVWALVDEESLTWHDHISKTFPTAG